MLKFLRSLLTTSVLTSIVFLAIGLALVFYPEASLTVLANTIAVVLIVYGVYGLLLSFQSISITYSLNIGTSIIALILGIVVLSNNNVLTAIMPIILGLFFLINSLNKLRYALVLKSQGKIWLAPMLISLLLMFCGVLMLAHPIFSAITLTTFIGILMVAYAIVDLIDAAFLHRYLSTIENYMHGKRGGRKSASGKIREAEIVDKKRK